MELIIALPIILIAASMLYMVIIVSARQRTVNRENAIVAETARSILERMRNEDLADVFVLYNQEPFDDPNGPGTAPGHRFDVPGVRELPDTEDGFEGEIILPAVDVSETETPIWQIREDIAQPDLGMPRDLSGDNLVDGEDHSGDYTVLPVMIIVRWQGRMGPRNFRFHTMLTDYRL